MSAHRKEPPHPRLIHHKHPPPFPPLPPPSPCCRLLVSAAHGRQTSNRPAQNYNFWGFAGWGTKRDEKCVPQRGGLYYRCAIQAMVRDWRAKFNLALPFLWVQISPWEGHEAATSTYQLPDMRLAQMAANELPLTAMATAVDLGPPANANGWDSGDEHGPDPWGNVHFRNKVRFRTSHALVSTKLPPGTSVCLC